METAQWKQIGVIAVIIILGLILLPLVAGIISLIIKIVLFLAIVAGLYWAYVTFIKK
ncbi:MULTISPECIES: hypothetical protein [Lacticaseibacillus]|uniref:DUF3096 domain-containing protein n=1 Tax=Lacticaseibacillus hegangensis TaxID=2486010 RepID=A0ABW4CVJ0_9LACO|nr:MULTISPECIES: hypothetical protein [Lacticaseibacillus]